MVIEVGREAPAFIGQDDTGSQIKLSDFKGKKIVLFFYPKDNTPGCTTESCGFRDQYAEFEKHGAVVIGVSKDTVTSHKKFKEKYNFPYPLIADEDKSICQSFGVLKEKSMFGKKYMGIERSTFIIDEKGIVTHAWRKVKVIGHVKEVLEAVQS